MQLFRKIFRFVLMTVISLAYAGSALVVGSSLAAGSPLEKDAKMLGTWCSEDEREILYWEESSIGFNEHTVCEFDKPLATGPHTIMTLECANIYFQGDEIVRAFEKTVLFEAFYTSPNRLRVIMDTNQTPILFTRCYE